MRHTNVQDFLQTARRQLTDAGIDTARLDLLILLEDVLGTPRASLLAHPEMSISSEQLSLLNNFVTQRKQHIPLAYIRGKAAFFGREFIVDKHVLVPRPESESIIELLQAIPSSADHNRLVADIGCGSGCLGISAALTPPKATVVHFYDIDTKALDVARQNASRHTVPSEFYNSDLLSHWYGDYTIVLANLPYVPDEYPINRAAGFEPALALFSGPDGLNHYRRLWQQIGSHHPKPKHVISEALPEQHSQLTGLAARAGYELAAALGYAQHFSLVHSVSRASPA